MPGQLPHPPPGESYSPGASTVSVSMVKAWDLWLLDEAEAQPHVSAQQVRRQSCAHYREFRQGVIRAGERASLVRPGLKGLLKLNPRQHATPERYFRKTHRTLV